MSEIKLSKQFYPGMYDIIARKIFESEIGKELICVIYNGLELGNTISPEDIVFIDPNLINGVQFKTSELDVRFNITSLDNNITADIEFQNYKRKDFLKRLAYYQAGQIVDSVSKGDPYKFEVLLISICDFVINDNNPNKDFITMLQRRDINRLDGLSFSFDTIILLQLPYINKCDKMKLVKLFQIMKSENPKEFKGDERLMDELIDRIYYYNNDYETRLKIRLQEKAELDSKMALDYLKDEAREAGHAEGKAEGLKQGLAEGRNQGLVEGRNKGLAEGRTQGLAEGRAEGIAMATKEFAKKLKEQNCSLDLIISTTGLTKEDIENL